MIEPSHVSTADGGVDMAPFRQVFDRLRRRTRLWIWVEAVGMILLAATVFFWGSLVIDRLVEPPVAVRAAALLALAGAILWVVAAKLVARLRVTLRDRDLAILVERHHPEFADSLSTVVDRSDSPTDRGLLERTVRSAREHLPAIRLERLFRSGTLSALVSLGLLGLLTVVVLVREAPATADVWGRRMLLLQDARWPRETTLEALDFNDGVRVVARGSDVDVLARASRRIPDVVDLRVRAADGGRTERMGSRGGVSEEGQLFGHLIEGVREDLQLTIRGGDAKLDNLMLKVLDPPAVDRLEIAYTLPAYLGGGRRTVPASAVVQVPRGAAVEIACGSTKPLASATISTRSTAAATSESDAVLPEMLVTLTAPASDAPAVRAISGTIASLDSDRLVNVSLTDTDGLTNLKPIGFRLVAAADQPPQVAIRMLGISTAVTPKARVPLVGTVTDDHALGGVTVQSRRMTAAEAGRPLERNVSVERLAAGAPRLDLPESGPEMLSLEPLGAAVGDTVTVLVTAVDTCTLDGGPQASSSDAWSLQVVSPEVLAAMLEARELVLRRRFENVVEEVSTARSALAAATDVPAASSRMGEAASRAAGETAEIAEAFLMIRREFDNNGLLTNELDTRLFAQIAGPLGEIAAADLPRLQAACRQVSAGQATGSQPLVARADAVILRMRAVLDRMMELETFNEVVELLRSAIRTQEEIRAETLKRQKERARALLEEP